MAEKIARLGIERDNDLMYYIKNGDVWATPRKKAGQPKGKPQKVASAGVDLDYSQYIYFLDGDGDVARKARATGGGRRKTSKRAASNGNGNGKTASGGNGNGKTANGGNGSGKTPRQGKRKAKGTARSSITGHYVKPSTAKRHPEATVTESRPTSGKSEAEIARECDEILAATAPAAAGARKKTGWY